MTAPERRSREGGLYPQSRELRLGRPADQATDSLTREG
jgi:hypothetical protein